MGKKIALNSCRSKSVSAQPRSSGGKGDHCRRKPSTRDKSFDRIEGPSSGSSSRNKKKQSTCSRHVNTSRSASSDTRSRLAYHTGTDSTLPHHRYSASVNKKRNFDMPPHSVICAEKTHRSRHASTFPSHGKTKMKEKHATTDFEGQGPVMPQFVPPYPENDCGATFMGPRGHSPSKDGAYMTDGVVRRKHKKGPITTFTMDNRELPTTSVLDSGPGSRYASLYGMADATSDYFATRCAPKQQQQRQFSSIMSEFSNSNAIGKFEPSAFSNKTFSNAAFPNPTALQVPQNSSSNSLGSRGYNFGPSNNTTLHNSSTSYQTQNFRNGYTPQQSSHSSQRFSEPSTNFASSSSMPLRSSYRPRSASRFDTSASSGRSKWLNEYRDDMSTINLNAVRNDPLGRQMRTHTDLPSFSHDSAFERRSAFEDMGLPRSEDRSSSEGIKSFLSSQLRSRPGNNYYSSDDLDALMKPYKTGSSAATGRSLPFEISFRSNYTPASRDFNNAWGTNTGNGMNSDFQSSSNFRSSRSLGMPNNSGNGNSSFGFKTNFLERPSGSGYRPNNNATAMSGMNSRPSGGFAFERRGGDESIRPATSNFISNYIGSNLQTEKDRLHRITSIISNSTANDNAQW